MEHERTFLGLFWGLMLLGVAMCKTDAPEAGVVFIVLALIALIPYAIVNGILTDPKDKQDKFPEC